MSVGVCLIVGNSTKYGKETYLKLKTPEGHHPFSVITEQNHVSSDKSLGTHLSV